jgi:hypothetical protein
VLPGAPELNAQLPPTAEALERFATNPDVQGGISRSTQTLNYLSPTLRFVTPAQSVCNYGTLLFRNASSLLSIGDGIATSQRFLVMSSAGGPNNETAPASAPANKEGNETNGAGDPEANFLHSNPYPNTASPGQHPRECEAGNEDYLVGQKVIGNVPGNQGIKTQDQIPEQLK